MNKDQFARLERHRKVKQKLADWKPAVDAVPAFAELAADYLGRLALLDGTARKRPVTSQGATAANNTASDALIARLVKMANALWLLYRKEGNQAEADKLPRRASAYQGMQELELATIGLDLSKRVTARKGDLANYNIKDADVTALATDALAFDQALQNPQLAIDDQKLKGAAAKANLSALNHFLRDDLRAGMELLKDTEPDAYQALREASQVDDPGYRQRKARRMTARAGQDGGAVGNGSN